MNTISKIFLNTILGFEHLEGDNDLNSRGEEGKADTQYDSTKITQRYQFAKEVSDKNNKEAINLVGQNIGDIDKNIINEKERENFIRIAKKNITDQNYLNILGDYAIHTGIDMDYNTKSYSENFTKAVSWKLQQVLKDVLVDPDVKKTFDGINSHSDSISKEDNKFLFLVGLYQILSKDYEAGAKAKYNQVIDDNGNRAEGKNIDFKLIDFIAGPVLLNSLSKTKQDLASLKEGVISNVGPLSNLKNPDINVSAELMGGIPGAKNTPTPTTGVETTPSKTENRGAAVVAAPAPAVGPEAKTQSPVETDLGDGDKTKKEMRKEKKLDKSQEKSTETLTNDSYSGKRIQKASEEIIVQALEETLEGNENVGGAIGLSKTLTTLQGEHKKKAKSLDATSREDQDKLIASKEKKVKADEDKFMEANDNATAKVLNATKDEIKTLDKKADELESIRTSTDAKETERTNALNKANSGEKAADKINWFNRANILRGEVKTEKMKEVKNIQDKTTKVSDYYKEYLDAVNKPALIFQNRVKRYKKAVNSIKASINSYAQQFQKNVYQKQLSAGISEDASGNVVYPDGFDNFLNLPTTIGASATKQLYNKVLENSNAELRTEIDYLYLKLTGITNSENTDVTGLDLTKKEGEDNYNTILAQSQKSLRVIEAEKSNLQNIYKTGPDGYIMIKGNQEADMKEYEILYSEFSTLTQEYLKGGKEYNDKATDSEAQSKLLWDSPTGRRMQYKTWINEVAARMNDLVGNKAESADTASAVLAKNSNYSDTSSINYLYPPSDTSSLSTLTTGKIGTANTLLRAFDGQENNKLPYELTNPVKKSVLELGDEISSNTNIDYKAVAKDYKNYIEEQGR